MTKLYETISGTPTEFQVFTVVCVALVLIALWVSWLTTKITVPKPHAPIHVSPTPWERATEEIKSVFSYEAAQTLRAKYPKHPFIAPAYMLTPEQLNTATGQNLNPRITQWEPQGGRILIVVDRVPEMQGNIIVAETTRALATMGTGWIAGLGPTSWGNQHAGQIGAIHATNPWMLLGQHVMFGLSRGTVMRYSALDDGFNGKVLMLAPIDLWALDMHPDPLSVDDFQLAFEKRAQFLLEEEAAQHQLELDRELQAKDQNEVEDLEELTADQLELFGLNDNAMENALETIASLRESTVE